MSALSPTFLPTTIHLFIHLFIYSFIHLFIYSFIHLFIYLLTFLLLFLLPIVLLGDVIYENRIKELFEVEEARFVVQTKKSFEAAVTR